MDKEKFHVKPLNLRFIVKKGNPIFACVPDRDSCRPSFDFAECGTGSTNVCHVIDLAACYSGAIDRCDSDWGTSCSTPGQWDCCGSDNNANCEFPLNDSCGFGDFN